MSADDLQTFTYVVADDAGHAPIRERVQRRVVEDSGGNRAYPTCRNLITCERLPGARVADGRRHAREVSAAPRFRCDRGRLESRCIEPRSLITREKEHFVEDYGPTKGASENVLPAIGLRRVRSIVHPRIRVHLAVAVELE